MKNLLLILLSGIMVFSAAAPAATAEPKESMTHAQFANLLVEKLGIQLPDEAADFSEAELFEFQADILSRRGISLFADTKADAVVTRGDLLGVISDALTRFTAAPPARPSQTRGSLSNLYYNPITGYSRTQPGDVVSSYLDELGYGKEETYKDIMNFAEVVEALNIPELSGVVAQAYSPPGTVPGAGGVFVGPQNPTPEDPLTPTLP